MKWWMRQPYRLYLARDVEPPDSEEVTAFCRGLWQERNKEAKQQLLTATLSQWLKLGGVHPKLSWTRHGPAITYETSGLFGALGAFLLQEISGKRVATCIECGGLIDGTGYRYCNACIEDGVPQRQAVKRFRAGESKPRKRRVRHD